MDTENPPWPHQQLNVAALREAGVCPWPFRQFVLKIYSRCNLACRYCYVYELEDQSWRNQPRVMSAGTVRAAVARIAEHARAHGLAQVRVILHGGEPLLAGPAFIQNLADRVRDALSVTAAVDLVVQTNGIRLDETMLTVLRHNAVRVGVSLDGDQAATDRHRQYRGGRGSYRAVTRGLDLLRDDRYRASYAGLLCTVGLDNDPVQTYEALIAYEPPMIDFLLPHGTWSSPPPSRRPDTSTPYADWLLAVFDRWRAAPKQETSIRLFDAIISLLLGGPGTTEVVGLGPADTIVIDTDGSIRQIDALSAAYENAASTGLDVRRHALDAALDHPTTVARQLGRAALSPVCQTCGVRDVCGGGFYPHRYRAGEGFRNPSVYCADLLRLITAIREYVVSETARLATVTSVQCRR
jgi:uncharacterized protein